MLKIDWSSLSLKRRIKTTGFRFQVFSVVKTLIILISIGLLFWSSYSLRGTLDRTFFIKPVSPEQKTFFHLEKLKQIGPSWGIEIK